MARPDKPELPKTQLIELLERQLFQPLRDINSDRFPSFQRADIDQLKIEIAGVEARVHAAESETQLVQVFHDASGKSAESGLDTRLSDLDLPTLAEARYHFDTLAAEMSVIRS